MPKMKREKVMQVKGTEEEFEEIKIAAQESGMSVSAFLRFAVKQAIFNNLGLQRAVERRLNEKSNP